MFFLTLYTKYKFKQKIWNDYKKWNGNRQSAVQPVWPSDLICFIHWFTALGPVEFGAGPAAICMKIMHLDVKFTVKLLFSLKD